MQTIADRQQKSRRAVHHRILLYMAWRNIAHKKLRSFLTILGIVIGVGSITFLISFGLGLQELVKKQVVGDRSLKSIDISSPNSRLIKLDSAALNRIKKIPHIEKVGVEYAFPSSIGLKGGGSDAVLYAVDKNYQDLTSIDILAGKRLETTDTNTAIISTSALKAIGINDRSKAVGQKLSVVVPLQYDQIKDKEFRKDFTITGVLEAGSNNEVFVSSTVFDVIGVPTYKQFKVIVDDTKNIASVRKQIESTGIQTSSPIDTLEQINQLFRIFNIVLGGFGAIGIIVAILGMFNTLTISLIERTKEIGLMISLGARRKNMRSLFLVEALILSLIGSTIGIIGAIAGTKLFNWLFTRNASSRGLENFEIFSTPFWLVLQLTGFMILIGLAVVFFPARRAEQINPIDALRRE